MRGKLMLVVGLATGYVLGAKAGRGRYEEIKRAASTVWGDPRVQRLVTKTTGRAKDFARAKAPALVDFLGDGAKKIVSQVSKAPSGKTPSRRPSQGKASQGKASPGTSPAARSAAAAKRAPAKPASRK